LLTQVKQFIVVPLIAQTAQLFRGKVAVTLAVEEQE
jgi:hypothetical protein